MPLAAAFGRRGRLAACRSLTGRAGFSNCEVSLNPVGLGSEMASRLPPHGASVPLVFALELQAPRRHGLGFWFERMALQLKQIVRIA